jgi:putrescine transport system permease protein
MTRWLLRALFLLGMFILLAPLVVVVANSFNADVLLSGWGGFTTHWFQDVAGDESVRHAAMGSLKIALAATAGSAVLGTLVVGFSSYAPRTLGRLTDALTVSRIMMPEIVIASGLIVFLPRFGFSFGTPAVIVGHIVWDTAFFISIAGARRAGFDRTLEEAARDLGASPFRVFRTITVPDLVPGLVAGALLAFTFSFDDVVTSVFLSGPDTSTLPLEILSRIRHGINPSINAIGVLVMAVTVVGLGAATALGGAGTIRLPRRDEQEASS